MGNYLKKRVKLTETESTTLLGAHVPDSVAAYVALFCEADGCTKTSIIAPLIEEWAKKAKKKFSRKDLIRLAANRGLESWKNRKTRSMIFNTYISKLQRELKRRLPEDIVEEIIELIKYEKDNQKQAKTDK